MEEAALGAVGRLLWRRAVRILARSSDVPKGLDNIIVRTQIQGADLFFLAGSGRKHNDGKLGPGPDVPDDFQAVHIRKPKVQKHHIRAERCG